MQRSIAKFKIWLTSSFRNTELLEGLSAVNPCFKKFWSQTFPGFFIFIFNNNFCLIDWQSLTR